MPDESAQQTELVMSEAEFDLAQDRFMRTIEANGWVGMDREGFVVYIAIPYMNTLPFAVEAKRLVVHYLHIREGKDTIEAEVIKAAEEHLAAYQETLGYDYEVDFYPNF